MITLCYNTQQHTWDVIERIPELEHTAKIARCKSKYEAIVLIQKLKQYQM